MATTILLKRSLTTSIPASLANGEPAYTANGDVLYIGSNGGIVAVGGKRVPGFLTANQAIVADGSSMIDKIMWGNSTVNAVVNSLSLTLANSTVTWSLVKPTAAQVTAANYFPASDGTWKQSGGGTPGGANTNVEFNDSGVFGGSAGFTYDKTTNIVFIGNAASFGNSSVNAIVNSIGLSLNAGQVVVNNSVLQNGANVVIGTVTISVGNTTVNNQVNSLGISLNGGAIVVNNSVFFAGNSTVNTTANNTVDLYQNSTVTTSYGLGGANVGSNVTLNTVQLFFGNSSVNAIVNSVALAFNGAVTINSTSMNTGLLGATQVNTAANLSFTGANVSIPNANLAVKDLNVSGNLTVTGTVTAVDATNLQVKDSLIKLADGQTAADTLDIGFYGMYFDGTNTRFRGLVWDASNSQYLLWSNTLAEPTSTLDTANLSLAVASLQSYLHSGNMVSNSSVWQVGANSTYTVSIVANTLTLSTALGAGSGGTGLTSFATGDILIGNSTGGLNKVAVPATDGSFVNWTAAGGVAWTATMDGGTFLWDTLLLNTINQDFEPVLAKGNINKWKILDMAISGYDRSTI